MSHLTFRPVVPGSLGTVARALEVAGISATKRAQGRIRQSDHGQQARGAWVRNVRPVPSAHRSIARGCQVRKVTALIAVAGLLVFGLAACGSDDDSGGSGSGGGGSARRRSAPTSTSRRVHAGQGRHADRRDEPSRAGLLERRRPGLDQRRLRVRHGAGHGQARRASRTSRSRTSRSTRSVAGQTSDFDVALSQVTITPERAKVVCFTDRYFSSDQGILVRKGHRGRPRRTRSRSSGASRASTTGQTFLDDKIKPDSEPSVYQDTPAMFTALDAEPDRRRAARHRDRARPGRRVGRRARGRRPVQDRRELRRASSRAAPRTSASSTSTSRR